MANAGMDRKAIALGADQLTFPDNDHCIGTDGLARATLQ